MERGKELEVKKEKLDQKVALSLNDANQSSASKTPDMDSRQPSKILSKERNISR